MHVCVCSVWKLGGGSVIDYSVEGKQRGVCVCACVCVCVSVCVQLGSLEGVVLL